MGIYGIEFVWDKNLGNLKPSKLESELFNSEIWPNAMG
jgi:hypothetical protein